MLDINEALPVKCKKSDVKEFPRLPIPSSLPKPQFQVKQSYNKTLAPKRAASYFRYIEKSLEELDQEVCDIICIFNSIKLFIYYPMWQLCYVTYDGKFYQDAL